MRIHADLRQENQKPKCPRVTCCWIAIRDHILDGNKRSHRITHGTALEIPGSGVRLGSVDHAVVQPLSRRLERLQLALHTLHLEPR